MAKDESLISALMKHDISSTAVLVYLLIKEQECNSADRGIVDENGDPFSFMGQKKIAKKTGKSRRTISRAVRQLKDAGLLKVKQKIRNGHYYPQSI